MLQLRILEQQLARRNRVGTVWSAKVKRTIVWKGVSSSGKVGCRRGFSFLLVDMYSLLFFLFFLEYAKVRARHPDLRKRLAGYIIYSFPPFLFSFWNMPRCWHSAQICDNNLQAASRGFSFFPVYIPVFSFFSFWDTP